MLGDVTDGFSRAVVILDGDVAWPYSGEIILGETT